MSLYDTLVFNDQGMIPAVIQDDASGEVLTLCYMTKEALDKTIESGLVHVFRRSLGKLMMKGETSGHTQAVKSICIDCEGKSLVIRIDQKVAACHKNFFTCYFRQYHPETGEIVTVGEPMKE